jgi:hypothetical protein
LSHRRIKIRHRGHTETQRRDAEVMAGLLAEETLTPVLNAALSYFMKDSSFRDADRVNLCMMRFAWGNWSHYALKSAEPSPQILDEDIPHFTYLLFGAGPCLLCGKAAKKQDCLPNGFRLHRLCIARAYARDAAIFGNDDQKQWAAEILAGDSPK